MLKLFPDRIKGQILIAPGIPPHQLSQLPKSVTANLPTLLFWSRKDSVIPFDRSANVLTTFAKAQLVDFERVTRDNDPDWIDHVPELVMVTEFQKQVQQWLATISS